MSPELFAVLELALLLLLGKFSEEAFAKLGLTSFVGAILVGILLGPGVLKALYPTAYVSEFINLGIVFILFMAGVEERPAGRRIGVPALAGLIAFAISFFLIYELFARFIGLGYIPSFVAAVVLAMVSAGPFSRTLGEAAGEGEAGRDLFVEVLAMEIAAVITFSFVLTGTPSSALQLMYSTLKLVSVIASIMVFSKYALHRAMKAVEGRFRSWEAPFGFLVGVVLLAGFVAQSVGFNSAIAAFLLGAFASEHIKEDAYLLEKLRAITFGFFEPMFFMGLGLYVTSVTGTTLLLGLFAFAASLAAKAASAYLVDPLVKAGRLKNFFAISHEGGVDGALLLTALQMSLISPRAYSFAMLAVAALAVIAPIGYRGISPIREKARVSPVGFMRFRLSSATALELSKTLPTAMVSESDPIIKALRVARGLDARVMAVVDGEGRPVGYVNVHDLFRIASYGFEDEPVSAAQVHPIPRVKANEPASRVLDIFRTSDAQIVAVVDDEGRLVGTILEREVLKYLLESS